MKNGVFPSRLGFFCYWQLRAWQILQLPPNAGPPHRQFPWGKIREFPTLGWSKNGAYPQNSMFFQGK
jgi:hypothetical protein